MAKHLASVSPLFFIVVGNFSHGDELREGSMGLGASISQGSLWDGGIQLLLAKPGHTKNSPLVPYNGGHCLFRRESLICPKGPI